MATVKITKISRFYRGGTLVSTKTANDSGESGKKYTPSKHMPGYDSSVYTSYKITYNGQDLTQGFIMCPSYNFTVYYYFYGEAEVVEPDKPTVKKWDWYSSNGTGGSSGNATASQTRAAYNAVTGKGKTSNFAYEVWNDMVNKVHEILSAKGLSWDNEFTSFSGAKMSSSNKVLTAAKFNSLRYNIGLHYSTGISTVSKGDTVYGWYFTTLTDCMNRWIDQ